MNLDHPGGHPRNSAERTADLTADLTTLPKITQKSTPPYPPYILPHTGVDSHTTHHTYARAFRVHFSCSLSRGRRRPFLHVIMAPCLVSHPYSIPFKGSSKKQLSGKGRICMCAGVDMCVRVCACVCCDDVVNAGRIICPPLTWRSLSVSYMPAVSFVSFPSSATLGSSLL